MKSKERSDAITSGHVGSKLRVWGEPQQAASVPCAATEALLAILVRIWDKRFASNTLQRKKL